MAVSVQGAPPRLARAQAGLSRLLLNTDEPTLRVRITRGTTGTLGIRLTTIGLGFVANVLLARLLGTSGFGAYAFALAWVTVLGVPAMLGFDKLLIREIVTYRAQASWGAMRGLLRRANQATLAVSVALGALTALGAWALGGLDSETVSALLVAAILLPVIVLTRLRQTALQGLDYVVLGQLPEALIKPVLLIGMAAAGFLVLGGDVSASGAMGMLVAAAGISFLVGAHLFRRLLPRAVKLARPEYRTSVWVRSALPLLLIGILQIVTVRCGVLLLGSMRGPEEAGVYAVVSGLGDFIPFFLVGLSPVLAPIIARLYVERDLERLERVVTRSALAIFLVALPIALLLIALGGPLLALFGSGFTQGHAALAILAVGQLANAATGLVGVLLIMTGHERDATMAAGVGALANVALNALLIPIWGVEGAALGACSSLVLWSAISVLYVHRRLGIHATPFALALRRTT